MGVVDEGTLLRKLSSCADSSGLLEVYHEPAWVASRDDILLEMV